MRWRLLLLIRKLSFSKHDNVWPQEGVRGPQLGISSFIWFGFAEAWHHLTWRTVDQLSHLWHEENERCSPGSRCYSGCSTAVAWNNDKYWFSQHLLLQCLLIFFSGVSYYGFWNITLTPACCLLDFQVHFHGKEELYNWLQFFWSVSRTFWSNLQVMHVATIITEAAGD